MFKNIADGNTSNFDAIPVDELLRDCFKGRSGFWQAYRKLWRYVLQYKPEQLTRGTRPWYGLLRLAYDEGFQSDVIDRINTIDVNYEIAKQFLHDQSKLIGSRSWHEEPDINTVARIMGMIKPDNIQQAHLALYDCSEQGPMHRCGSSLVAPLDTILKLPELESGVRNVTPTFVSIVTFETFFGNPTYSDNDHDHDMGGAGNGLDVEMAEQEKESEEEESEDNAQHHMGDAGNELDVEMTESEQEEMAEQLEEETGEEEEMINQEAMQKKEQGDAENAMRVEKEQEQIMEKRVAEEARIRAAMEREKREAEQARKEEEEAMEKERENNEAGRAREMAQQAEQVRRKQEEAMQKETEEKEAKKMEREKREAEATRRREQIAEEGKRREEEERAAMERENERENERVAQEVRRKTENAAAEAEAETKAEAALPFVRPHRNKRKQTEISNIEKRNITAAENDEKARNMRIKSIQEADDERLKRQNSLIRDLQIRDQERTLDPSITLNFSSDALLGISLTQEDTGEIQNAWDSEWNSVICKDYDYTKEDKKKNKRSEFICTVLSWS